MFTCTNVFNCDILQHVTLTLFLYLTKQVAVASSKPSLGLKNVSLCIWWHCVSVINFELLNPSETVTADLYYQQLDRFRNEILVKRPFLINRKVVVLQHDISRPHAARLTQEKIRQLNWKVIPHPSYFPDIVASNFHLFQSLENSLRNKMY